MTLYSNQVPSPRKAGNLRRARPSMSAGSREPPTAGFSYSKATTPRARSVRVPIEIVIQSLEVSQNLNDSRPSFSNPPKYKPHVLYIQFPRLICNFHNQTVQVHWRLHLAPPLQPVRRWSGSPEAEQFPSSATGQTCRRS